MHRPPSIHDWQRAVSPSKESAAFPANRLGWWMSTRCLIYLCLTPANRPLEGLMAQNIRRRWSRFPSSIQQVIG